MVLGGCTQRCETSGNSTGNQAVCASTQNHPPIRLGVLTCAGDMPALFPLLFSAPSLLMHYQRSSPCQRSLDNILQLFSLIFGASTLHRYMTLMLMYHSHMFTHHTCIHSHSAHIHTAHPQTHHTLKHTHTCIHEQLPLTSRRTDTNYGHIILSIT